MSKYALNSAEERYQPGSGDQALANKLGIADAEEMGALESGLLPLLTAFHFFLMVSRSSFSLVLMN
ncbi:hypothetical protein HA48_03915 [Pantoea wallisii]|uniref:Uncharacterized protein n=1 Tax=Pantoea wallisii TaxID=1076551 RepID=A0A1X1DCJ4_9GAMM|nr:hypothetical protein HA48_03915 [Pantoea wallisii]